MSYLYQEDDSSYPNPQLNTFEIDDLENRLNKRFDPKGATRFQVMREVLYALYENLYEAAHFDRKDINEIMQFLQLQWNYCDKEFYELKEKDIYFRNLDTTFSHSEYLNILKNPTNQGMKLWVM